MGFSRQRVGADYRRRQARVPNAARPMQARRARRSAGQRGARQRQQRAAAVLRVRRVLLSACRSSQWWSPPGRRRGLPRGAMVRAGVEGQCEPAGVAPGGELLQPAGPSWGGSKMVQCLLAHCCLQMAVRLSLGGGAISIRRPRHRCSRAGVAAAWTALGRFCPTASRGPGVTHSGGSRGRSWWWSPGRRRGLRHEGGSGGAGARCGARWGWRHWGAVHSASGPIRALRPGPSLPEGMQHSVGEDPLGCL